MKRIKYKLIILFLICNGIIQAQKLTKEFTKEISSDKNTIELLVDYADIEIIEWNKNKIKIEAIMTVEGVTKNEAKKKIESWNVDILRDGKKIKIISKYNEESEDKEYFSNKNLVKIDSKIPEISLESLGILDSMNFSFPEINFSEILNDTIFTRIYKYDFNYLKKDSIIMLDAKTLKKNIEYLKKWQSDNKENFEKLQKITNEFKKKQKQKNRHKELLEKINKIKTERIKEQNEKRKKLLEKINKVRIERKNNIEKKRENIRKNREKLKMSRNKIREILKNRHKSKIRTKLKIQVPKGTKFIMEINYCKVTTA